ncbi:MAG TPA: choice-of-anchor L domain-containing protein [Cyclobacteriaceae bacterium]
MKYNFLISTLVSVLFLLLGQSYSAWAQTKFEVDDTVPIETIVKSLEGPNVEISNITHSGHTAKKPVGSFNDVLHLLDFSKGLIMTTGSAKLAIGPNNSSNKGAGDSGTTSDSDPDLETVVPGEVLYDLVVIEFDVRVSNSVLSFNYIFGSEEYPEYERQYNDVFGFFISGPGITGVKNLATINGNTPVSVKSINSKKNTDYFVSNGGGDNPAHDFYLQYDGYTKKLTAKTEVIPCETYHIKLAIADARDDILDSGVLIEQGSFTGTSKLNIDVAFEHEGIDYAVEGCNKGYFIVKKNPEWIDPSSSFEYEFSLSGTAVNGDDYTLIPGNTFTIPANEESVKMEINALMDGIPEGIENVILNIILKCNGSTIAAASAQMDIRDEIEFPINSTVCKDILMPINTPADPRWTFVWDANAALSCTACSSPNVQLSSDADFGVHVKDNVSTCETNTVAHIVVQNPKAKFDYSTDPNYPTNEISFKNLSLHADGYLWDFGDGQSSSDANPEHVYAVEGRELVSFTVTLTASSFNGLCKDTYDTIVVIEPLFIPNVITPNISNQKFSPLGIKKGFWRITIYNRWGRQVYSSLHYNKDWGGEDVSMGVYYYELINPPGDRKYKGWIQVLK